MKESILQKNLKLLLEDAGWSPTELSRRAEVPQPTVKRIIDGESKDPKRSNIEKLARAFYVTVNSLYTDRPQLSPLSVRMIDLTYDPYPKRTNSPQVTMEQKARHNVEQTRIAKTRNVPLISWVQAGAWNQAEEQNEAEEYLPCPVKHSDNTYALTVKGDSMTAPHGRSYPEGAIIYVDPDAAGNVTTGDRVIAKVNGDNAVTFKVYIEDGGKKYLKALNPSYPILTDDFRILGKIIGMWVPE